MPPFKGLSGASLKTIYWHVIMPLSLPVMVKDVTFTFICTSRRFLRAARAT